MSINKQVVLKKGNIVIDYFMSYTTSFSVSSDHYYSLDNRFSSFSAIFFSMCRLPVSKGHYSAYRCNFLSLKPVRVDVRAKNRFTLRPPDSVFNGF